MTHRLSRPQPANCGYYGQLSVITDNKLVPLYTTPELPMNWGLARMASHIHAIAVNMNADCYQLRRCLAGHDRPQGCQMMLTSKVYHD